MSWTGGLTSGGLMLLTCLALLASCAFVTARRMATTEIASPGRDAVFTSTREVTCLCVAADGSVWVGTKGGVLRCGPDGAWRKFTRADGLPSHEIRSIRADEMGDVTALTPRGSAVWSAGHWSVADGHQLAADSAAQQRVSAIQYPSAIWRGLPVEATPLGLRLGSGPKTRQVPLPPSTATHISAVLPHGDVLWVALFGDGVWSFDGTGWHRLDLGLPPAARQITALIEDAHTHVLWAGTRRAGVWERREGKWSQHLQSDEPYSHNVQAVRVFRDMLVVTTLEDGVVVRTASGWRHYGADELSSNLPRQMVEFHGALYVRYSSEKVDRFDGARWQRDVFPALPRRQIISMAADADRLYLGQWGGWSEFDGQHWKHYLTLRQLQILPLMTLYPDGDRLWIGTENRGLAEFQHSTGSLHWHDERQGLPDDWVTCLARCGGTLYAGTFVGGLAWQEGPQRWTVRPELRGQNVTALAPDAQAGLFIATRYGVWYREPAGAWSSLNGTVKLLDPEAQALCPTADGAWIGTRTGLFFVTRTR